MCLICQPMCEKCRPKFVVCESCGKRANIDFPRCLNCKSPITKEAKMKAREAWEAARRAGMDG